MNRELVFEICIDNFWACYLESGGVSFWRMLYWEIPGVRGGIVSSPDLSHWRTRWPYIQEGQWLEISEGRQEKFRRHFFLRCVWVRAGSQGEKVKSVLKKTWVLAFHGRATTVRILSQGKVELSLSFFWLSPLSYPNTSFSTKRPHVCYVILFKPANRYLQKWRNSSHHSLLRSEN